MTIRTRFAPSPTGALHIGGARTALFNYLFAKHHNGKFLLRIEDTDAERSTDKAKQIIIDSLEWLNIKHDEEIIYQSSRFARHIQIAHQLLKLGAAYYCFSPQEEIANLRNIAIRSKKNFIFHSPWRDSCESEYPQDIKPVIRLKSPHTGQTIINDLLQGTITIQNSTLDDMILLRSDGTPTYMLSSVVDDYDMKITHIIRGDDHLNSAVRQNLIYQSLDWKMPKMVHIPLIHGPDGAKLSKRHGALGVTTYKNTGYLPDAINNYLLKLGWAHNDDEIISRDNAIKYFDIDGLGQSPSRLDFDKMRHINSIYLRRYDNDALCDMIFDHFIEDDFNDQINLSGESKKYIRLAIDSMKLRSKLINDLYSLSLMYIIDIPLQYTYDAIDIIKDCDSELIIDAIDEFKKIEDFNKDNIQSQLKMLASSHNLKLGALMQILRAAISGRTTSPSIFEMIAIIGQDHSIYRLESSLIHKI